MDDTVQTFRLSPQQARRWAMLSAGDPSALRPQIAGLIDRSMHQDELQAAWLAVSDRYEILRSAFPSAALGTPPTQTIAVSAPMPLEVHDWTGLDLVARDRALDCLLERHRTEPFDLQSPPIMRAALCACGSQSVLCFTCHPLCTDWVSLRRLFREIVAGARGRSSRKPLQQADIAEWEHEMIASREGEDARRDWLAAPDRAPRVSALPLVDAPPEGRACRYVSVPIDCERSLIRAVRRISTLHEATAEAFVQACYHALLTRFAQSGRTRVMCEMNGRGLRELAATIGPLARMVPIEIDISPRDSILDVVRSCDLQRRLADANQHYLDAEVCLGVQGEPFAFGFESRRRPASRANDGSRFRIVRELGSTDWVHLTLVCRSGAGGFDLSLRYDESQVTSQDAARLASAYQALLTAAVDDPMKPVTELALVGREQRDRLSREWAEVETATGPMLLGAMARQAAQTPDAVAATADDGHVTYRALDTVTNRVARHLQRLGVTRGGRVALCGERSLSLLTALVAILKAGAAYVPIDESWPRQRQRQLVEDSETSLVLCRRAQRDRFEPTGVAMLYLEDLLAAAGGESNRPTAIATDGADLFAVIYTSGSTGTPKGVMVTHDGVANCVQWMQQHYRLDGTDRVAWKTTLTFDPSIWETLWPLSVGATIAIWSADPALDPAATLRRATCDHVTTLYAVPSLVTAIVPHASRDDAATLRRIISGGEALRTAVADQWLDATGVELHHSYGPTETSIAACEWTCVPAWQRKNASIGRPLANTRLYVCDERSGALVPWGMTGVLLIGGIGVGRGYWNKPAATAERFVPDPYATVPGSRGYDSGDLVRRLADGALEFVGRVDDQVKIAGVRIEPGEVEAVLREHRDVADAAVVVRVVGEAKALTAYWVPRQWPDTSSESVRTFLASRLPAGLVPAHLIAMERLPRTAGGKVDRQALPAPATADNRRRPDDLPSGLVELTLAEIWADVLKVDIIGRHDNFFELGGDSITSLRLVAAIREAGFAVTVQDLFQAQTIATLASALKPIGEGPWVESVPPLEPFALLSPDDRDALPADLEDAYPLAALQRGMLYEAEATANTPMYHGVNSWTFRGRMVPHLFQAAIDRVVARHPILRTSIALDAYSEPLQLVHRSAHLQVHVEDLRHVSTAEQDRIIAAHFERQRAARFDLSHPPLLRFSLHIRGDDLFEFGLTECHAIIDGWSLTATIGEAFRIYFALLDGRDVPIEPPPTSSFRDYVWAEVGSSRVDLQACKLEYSIVSPK